MRVGDWDKPLKSEHEFIADNKVLKEGFDKFKYQKLLFEKSLGITNLNLTNNFNYSLLKKRLKMMTKKSNSIVKIKYLLSMPTVLLIMILFLPFDALAKKRHPHGSGYLRPVLTQGAELCLTSYGSSAL